MSLLNIKYIEYKIDYYNNLSYKTDKLTLKQQAYTIIQSHPTFTQYLPQQVIKPLQSIKPTIQCEFQLDQISSVIDNQQDNQQDKGNLRIWLQVRNEWIVQVRKHIKDRIVSVVKGHYSISFQIKRLYQQDQEKLHKPIGLLLQLPDTLYPINLINKQSSQKIQQFGKALQKLPITQKSFHKIFKPLRMLGKGSSASVIQGLDLRNKRSYAIKCFKKPFCISPFTQQETLSCLIHPSICLSHGLFQSPSTIYLILQKYQQNLYDYIVTNGINNQYQLKEIVKGVLKGLEYIHEEGYMHRDVKPENIMVRKGLFQKRQIKKRGTDIQVVIIDFGFAQKQANPQWNMYKCGTPGYVAPEILKTYASNNQVKDSFNSLQSISKQRYTKSCDIFSLGCIFHLLLTNKLPFQGKTKQQLMKNNALVKIDYSSKDYQLLDILAKKLLFKMLQPNPQKRITACEALKDPFFQSQMFNFKPISLKTSFLRAQKQQKQILNQVDELSLQFFH